MRRCMSCWVALCFSVYLPIVSAHLPPLNDSHLLHGRTLPDRDTIFRHLGAASPSESRHSALRTSAAKYRMEMLKRDLLNKLNLTEVPEIDKSRLPVDVMTEVKDIMRINNISYPVPSDPSSTSTSTSSPRHRSNRQPVYPSSTTAASLAEFGPLPRKTLNITSESANNDENKQALQFRLNNDSWSYSHVTQATLMVLIRYKRSEDSKQTKKRENRIVNIHLYQIKDGPDGETRERISKHRVTVRHTKWLNLLVPTTRVQEVLATEEKILRLLVVCDGCDPNLQLVMVHKSGGRQTRSSSLHHKRRRRDRSSLSKRRPYLVLQTAPPSNFRMRARYKRHLEDSSSCCRGEETLIDLAGLDWAQWIISPSYYYDTICMSSCSDACCQPVETSPLTLVYLDSESRVKIATLADFISNACGCLT